MSVSSSGRGCWYKVFPLNLHPLPAFLLVLTIIFLPQQLWHLEKFEIVFPLSIAACAFGYLGYIVLTTLRLASLFPGQVTVKRGRLLAVFAFALVFYLLAFEVMQLMDESGPIGRGLLGVLWMFGVAAPLYILWIAARSLVSAEEGRRLTWDRNVGTFFLFYFLALGIFFIQMRLRRLLRAAGPAEGAAAVG